MARVAVMLGLIALVVGAGLAMRSARPQDSPFLVGSHDARLNDFGNGRALDAIMRLEHLYVRPDKGVLGRGESRARPDGLLVYSTLPGAPVPLPSTTSAKGPLAAGAGPDVASLAIDPRDWSHPERGIRANPEKRGRDWERGACLSFFESGRLIPESPVGVRIHGDSSRIWHERQSLRILLSPRYRSTVRDASVLLPPVCGPAFVIHADKRRLYFVNPIAYEIAAELGCRVAPTRLAKLVLNGEMRDGVYFLTEHVSIDYLRARFGHDDFFTYNRPRSGPAPKRYRKDYDKLRRAETMTVARAARVVDLDNVTDWFVTVLICGVYDFRQGLAFLDRRDPDARWRWVTWDLDWSFQAWPPRFPGSDAMERTFVEYALRKHTGDLRCLVFRRLIEDDGAYRRRVFERLATASITSCARSAFARGSIGIAGSRVPTGRVRRRRSSQAWKRPSAFSWTAGARCLRSWTCWDRFRRCTGARCPCRIGGS